MPRLSMKLAVGVAVVLSTLIAGLVYVYLQDVATQRQKDLTSVVVVVQDVGPKTVLTREMLKETKVPANFVQPGAVNKIDPIVGSVVKEQLVAGEQVVRHRLLLDLQGSGMAYQLPPGMRAYTLPINEYSGGAGFIRPGDKVDILATFDKAIAGDFTSNVILQDILVLAMNRNDVQPASNKAAGGKSGSAAEEKLNSVTLAVNADDAAKLALAEDRGRLRLSLRPFAVEAMPVVRTITPRDLVGYVYRAPEVSANPYVNMSNRAGGESYVNGGSVGAAAGRGPSVEVIRGTSIENVAVR